MNLFKKLYNAPTWVLVLALLALVTYALMTSGGGGE